MIPARCELLTSILESELELLNRAEEQEVDAFELLVTQRDALNTKIQLLMARLHKTRRQIDDLVTSHKLITNTKETT